MNIVFYFDIILPVIGYGGTERILFWHLKELVRQGHNVTLIGHPESKIENFGIKLIPLNLDDRLNWEHLIPKNTDIIHFNFQTPYLGNIPTINTLHGNGKVGEKFPFNTVFVSKKHAEIHNAKAFVHNALDFKEYPFLESKKKWNNFLFLAKASWKIKNLKSCVESCRKTNKHLQVVGGKWFGLSRYIHNHGIIGGDKKLNIIRECDALLFPVRWHEPFGIAIIEAMSQGLPVIGSPYGSLPELINEESGIIAKNQDELLAILKTNENKFDSKKIRKYAEENFGIEKYTRKYLNYYQAIINGKNLNETAPTWSLINKAEDLLPF
jgi:glycosyltransferase involved in cell wall biosynthesis